MYVQGINIFICSMYTVAGNLFIINSVNLDPTKIIILDRYMQARTLKPIYKIHLSLFFLNINVPIIAVNKNDWNANPESLVIYKICSHPPQHTASSIRPSV